MGYAVYLKRSAEKELEELPPRTHDRIVAALVSLKDNPFPRNAKKLHGREGMRIRIGNYRVLYVVNETDRQIEVISVADRKNAYR
jgi:mRNA interferase RelE/StbE